MIAILITIIALLDPVHGQFLEELYKTNKNLVYSIAYSIVQNTHDAEEIVQNVFLKAYFNIQTLEDKSQDDLVFWLKLCSRHRAIDFHRKKKHNLQSISIHEENEDGLTEYEIPDFSGIPETLCIDRELRMTILSKISKLPDEQRTVIIYRYYYDMRVKEIAGILGKKETVISSLIFRAKKTLEKELGDIFYE